MMGKSRHLNRRIRKFGDSDDEDKSADTEATKIAVSKSSKINSLSFNEDDDEADCSGIKLKRSKASKQFKKIRQAPDIPIAEEQKVGYISLGGDYSQDNLKALRQTQQFALPVDNQRKSSHVDGMELSGDAAEQLDDLTELMASKDKPVDAMDEDADIKEEMRSAKLFGTQRKKNNDRLFMSTAEKVSSKIREFSSFSATEDGSEWEQELLRRSGVGGNLGSVKQASLVNERKQLTEFDPLLARQQDRFIPDQSFSGLMDQNHLAGIYSIHQRTEASSITKLTIAQVKKTIQRAVDALELQGGDVQRKMQQLTDQSAQMQKEAATLHAKLEDGVRVSNTMQELRIYCAEVVGMLRVKAPMVSQLREAQLAVLKARGQLLRRRRIERQEDVLVSLQKRGLLKSLGGYQPSARLADPDYYSSRVSQAYLGAAKRGPGSAGVPEAKEDSAEAAVDEFGRLLRRSSSTSTSTKGSTSGEGSGLSTPEVKEAHGLDYESKSGLGLGMNFKAAQSSVGGVGGAGIGSRGHEDESAAAPRAGLGLGFKAAAQSSVGGVGGAENDDRGYGVENDDRGYEGAWAAAPRAGLGLGFKATDTSPSGGGSPVGILSSSMKKVATAKKSVSFTANQVFHLGDPTQPPGDLFNRSASGGGGSGLYPSHIKSFVSFQKSSVQAEKAGAQGAQDDKFDDLDDFFSSISAIAPAEECSSNTSSTASISGYSNIVNISVNDSISITSSSNITSSNSVSSSTTVIGEQESDDMVCDDADSAALRGENMFYLFQGSENPSGGNGRTSIDQSFFGLTAADAEGEKQRASAISQAAALVLADARPELSSVREILLRLQAFRRALPGRYSNAYVSLSLPALLGPLILLDTIQFVPLLLLRVPTRPPGGKRRQQQLMMMRGPPAVEGEADAAVELFLRPWYAPLRAYSIGEPINGPPGGSVASMGEPELLTERVAGYDVPEDSAAAEAGDGDLLPKIILDTLLPWYCEVVAAALDTSSADQCRYAQLTIAEFLSYDPEPEQLSPLMKAVLKAFEAAIADICLPVVDSDDLGTAVEVLTNQVHRAAAVAENLAYFADYLAPKTVARTGWLLLEGDNRSCLRCLLSASSPKCTAAAVRLLRSALRLILFRGRSGSEDSSGGGQGAGQGAGQGQTARRDNKTILTLGIPALAVQKLAAAMRLSQEAPEAAAKVRATSTTTGWPAANLDVLEMASPGEMMSKNGDVGRAGVISGDALALLRSSLLSAFVSL